MLLNYLAPGKIFLPVISVALFAGILNWTLIVITQLKFRRRLGAEAVQLAFKLPLHPVSNYLVLAFLAGVVVLMGFIESYRMALVVGPLWMLLLGVSYAVKKRVQQD